MRKFLLIFLVVNFSFKAYTQNTLVRPKLVVGIVVDQMRWDFLYRYYDRYTADGGFKRMLNQGFSCENTFIPYAPTVTACGHACIYTGTVPAFNGITGNAWWDNTTNQTMYCVQDDGVKTVGSSTTLGQMSPKNLFATTIGDELKMATGGRSKVIGVSLKDRGSILPAGHSANAAYWYDNRTGDWITSSYYMNDLPKWVKDLNKKKLYEKYYNEGWSTLYPIDTYEQSTKDDKPYENKTFGAGTNFPYNLKSFIGKSYSAILSTPHGNAFTLDMAKAALTEEALGKDNITDLLAISLSSPDYIGHSYGPNSIETEDAYLRLDKQLGDLLNFLNEKVGEGQYTIFLSADHGVSNIPAFLKEQKIPTGIINPDSIFNNLNKELKEKFGANNIVSDITNYQVYLNYNVLNGAKINKKEVSEFVINFLTIQEGVARAFETNAIATTTLNETLRKMLENGYYPARSGDIQIVLQSHWIESMYSGGTTHGLWNPYDSHIPLLWYGWGIKQGKINSNTYMTDIAPTIAALLRVQMPSSSIGNVITQALK